MTEQELSEIFRSLGAANPDRWAKSQIEEKIPQLQRYLFLRQAWKNIISDGDMSWIPDNGSLRLDSPGGGLGYAIERLMASGARSEDLIEIVRIMQWKTLFGLCVLLDDPGCLEPEVKNIAWGLFQVDENGHPIEPITGLSESVLETDPSGREMRPSFVD